MMEKVPWKNIAHVKKATKETRDSSCGKKSWTNETRQGNARLYILIKL